MLIDKEKLMFIMFTCVVKYYKEGVYYFFMYEQSLKKGGRHNESQIR